MQASAALNVNGVTLDVEWIIIRRVLTINHRIKSCTGRNRLRHRRISSGRSVSRIKEINAPC